MATLFRPFAPLGRPQAVAPGRAQLLARRSQPAALRAGQTLLLGGHIGRVLLQHRLAHRAHVQVWSVQTRALPGSWVLKITDMQGTPAADVVREGRLQRRAGGLRTIAALPTHVANRRTYLLLEHAQGPSLADVLADAAQQGQPLSFAKALRLFAQMAYALRDCHLQGIVHRDVKPANFLLMQSPSAASAPAASAGRSALVPPLASGGAADVLKLTDFGLARLLQEHCRDGAGTLAYLAPEIARGQAHGEAADIFALGASLMEMLVGVTPYEEDDEHSTWRALVAQSPSTTVADVEAILAARGVPFAVRAELGSLLRGMLHAEPEKRPSLAEVLAQPLYAFAAV